MKFNLTIWSHINRFYLTNFDINQTKPSHIANCKYCNQIETEQHHLLKCPIAEKVWCKFKSILEKLSDKPLDNEEKIFGLINVPKK